MADFFVSYTSSDKTWAEWIGQRLAEFGHIPHLHDWEVDKGGDISAWMEARHDASDHVLCVISAAYLKAPFSSWERRSAQWLAQTKRPNFMLPIFVEPCTAPSLLMTVKRCDLYGLTEDQASKRLADYLAPRGMPSDPVPFPGGPPATPVPFPGPPSRI
jgi:hypothetical protein